MEKIIQTITMPFRVILESEKAMWNTHWITFVLGNAVMIGVLIIASIIMYCGFTGKKCGEGKNGKK